MNRITPYIPCSRSPKQQRLQQQQQQLNGRPCLRIHSSRLSSSFYFISTEEKCTANQFVDRHHHFVTLISTSSFESSMNWFVFCFFVFFNFDQVNLFCCQMRKLTVTDLTSIPSSAKIDSGNAPIYSISEQDSFQFSSTKRGTTRMIVIHS